MWTRDAKINYCHTLQLLFEVGKNKKKVSGSKGMLPLNNLNNEKKITSSILIDTHKHNTAARMHSYHLQNIYNTQTTNNDSSLSDRRWRGYRSLSAAKSFLYIAS